MKKKEAIDVCNCILNWPYPTMRTTEENIGGLREVVSLLERGEKYEKMWEKSKKDLLRASVKNWKVSLKQIILEIKKLEQKYFPKGSKMLVTIEKVVENWWNTLDYDFKVELMANTYPDEAHLIEVEEMWNGLNFEQKYEIYSKSDDEVGLTKEEEDEIIGDREAHRRMVEGREIE